MRKAAAIAIVVFVLGFAGSVHALAVYDMDASMGGSFTVEGVPYSAVKLSGTLSIEEISGFPDLQAGQAYTWFYDFRYFGRTGDSGDFSFIGTRSHLGTADCTLAEYGMFILEGDDGAVLSRYQEQSWYDPFLGGLTFASWNQIDARPVPEPSTMLLLMAGLIGFGAFRKK
jgi:hypothetical protein